MKYKGLILVAIIMSHTTIFAMHRRKLGMHIVNMSIKKSTNSLCNSCSLLNRYYSTQRGPNKDGFYKGVIGFILGFWTGRICGS